MRYIKVPMVRVCQLTKYLSAVGVIDYLQMEKHSGPVRLRVRETPSGKRVKRHYAVFLILQDDQEVIGKKSELIPMSELMNPHIFACSKGEVREVIHAQQ